MAVLIALALLLLQLGGVHHHRHLEVGHGPQGHGSALHFADAGHHWKAADDGQAHGSHAEAAHPHVDVETKVVADGLIKAFADSLPPGLLFVLAFMLRLIAPPAPLLRSVISPPWRAPPRFALRPPSQAPPVAFSRSL